MDRDGVDLQVVSATPVLFAYGRPAEHAMECARIFNDALLELCAAGDGRLVPIGQVPLQDTDLACRELERCLAAGMKGVQIGNHVGDRDLDDDGLVTFLAHCAVARRAGLRAPVGHVRRLPAGGLDARLDGRHAGRDAAVAQPDDPRRRLRPAARATCASASPTAAGRSRSCSAGWRTPGTAATSCAGRSTAPPSTYLDRFEVDSAVYDGRALRYLVDVMGPSSVLLGSDYPFPLGEEHVGAGHPLVRLRPRRRAPAARRQRRSSSSGLGELAGG